MLIGAVVLYAEIGTFSLPAPVQACAGEPDDDGGLSPGSVVPALAKTPGPAAPLVAARHGGADARLGLSALRRHGRCRRRFRSRARPPAPCARPTRARRPARRGRLTVDRRGWRSRPRPGRAEAGSWPSSTISQYGYVVVLYGIGGTDGAVAASYVHRPRTGQERAVHESSRRRHRSNDEIPAVAAPAVQPGTFPSSPSRAASRAASLHSPFP